MTTALATIRHELTPGVWGMIEKFAPVVRASQLFGVKTVEQAIGIMVKGHELGLSLTASFDFINIIQDRPALNPRGALALIQQSPEFAGMKIEDLRGDKGQPSGCRVTMKRNNGTEYTTEFTMDDAKRADLIKPGSGWEKYPANMLRWRAIGYCADVVFPDIIGGMKRADEFGADISPDGNVITVEARPIQPSQPQTPQANTATLLNDLVTKFGAMAILQANNNKLPTTTEEVEALRVKLEGGATS